MWAVKSLVLGGAVTGILYAGVTTEAFLRPVSLTVKDDQVTFVRETPLGGVTARWSSEYALVQSDGVTECSASGTAFYQDAPGNSVTYTISDELRPCLEGEGQVIVHQQWQALLWDVFPLWPYRQSFVVRP